MSKYDSYASSTATLWAGAFLLLAAIHAPYLTLPYYWDELGQFVPQTLDLFNEGRFIPVRTLPNVHPPGVEVLLALTWKVAGGPSIPTARLLMLAMASFGVVGSFLLAIRLSRRAVGLPGFAALLLLLGSPLFYTQSMMVQLDMPAMVFTVWALLYFLDGRLWAAVATATVAVLMKETAVVLPVVLGAWILIRERDWRRAAFFLIPIAALTSWILFVWASTGHPLGDAAFSQYNAWYSLHPVRLLAALARRVYYLFFAELRWIGTGSLLLVWRRNDWLKSPEWGVAGIFSVCHVMVVSAFGGAVLERYLLPVLPVLFAAFAIAWSGLKGRLRVLVPGLAVAGSLLSMVWYPSYPFPYENNLAMVDFVKIHKLMAEFLASDPEIKNVATAWPLTDALRRPEFGYVTKPMGVIELHDFRSSNLRNALDQPVDALVVYNRDWNPRMGGVRRYEVVQRFLERYYDDAPPANGSEVQRVLGFRSKLRWELRGMWVELYR